MVTKHLSYKIQQYTQKKGNKVLFKGNLTLSELALQMWEMLNYQKIDAPNLSRVLNGKRLFTPQQLEAFCKVLNLNKYEIYNLRVALSNDYYQQYGLDIDLGISPYFLDMIDLQLKNALSILAQGNPDSAIDWITTLAEQVDMIIQTNQVSYSHPFRKLYARILLKKIKIYREVLLPSLALPIIKPLVKKIFVIAKNNDDRILFKNAFFSLGCAYHIAGQHESALNIFNQVLQLSKKSDTSPLLLRHTALSLAYLQRKKEYISIENQILHTVQLETTNNLSDICEVIEGLSRAQGILKIPHAFDTLYKAKKLHQQMAKKGIKVFIRDAQLIRTHLEIMRALDPKQKHFLKKDISIIQQVIKAHGYKRHAKIIARLSHGE